MKHVEHEELIDFVNQVMAKEHMEQIKTHLAEGCNTCERRLQMWRRVKRFAATETAYQPPEQTVRAAKNLFRGESSLTPRNRISPVEVLFDSFRQPLNAGVRAAGTGVRQLLFRAGGYEINLHVEQKPGGNIALVGQIAAISQQEACRGAFHVAARNRHGNSLHTASNENGEFYLEMQNSRDVELTLLGATRPIVISLGDPLQDTPGERK